MPDATYSPKVYRQQGGDTLVVASGGTLKLETGAVLTDKNGVDQSAALSTITAAVAAGYKIARGVTTTASASDTVVTGLATVVAAVASLEDAPGLGLMSAQAVVGDQAGAPAAGSILVKTWKATASGDCTPIAATVFTKKVSWIAVGT